MEAFLKVILSMWVTILFVLFCIGIAFFLLTALVKLGKFDTEKFQGQVAKAKELSAGGADDRAQKLLLDALRDVGWDYGALLTARKQGRVVGIESLRSFWYNLLNQLKLIKQQPLNYAGDGFLALGAIFEKRGEFDRALTLYEDLDAYLAGYQDDVSRILRSQLMTEVHNRRCNILLSQGEGLAALRSYVSFVLEQISAARLINDDVRYKSLFPHNGEDRLDRILDAMNRLPEDRDKVIALINGAVDEAMGRIYQDRALIEINKNFAG